MYMYPHKRNVDALPKVGVIIKVLIVVVFRTLCCVVATITLATDCCCSGQSVQHLDVNADGC